MSSSGLSDISSSLSSDDGDIDISDAPKKGSLEFFFKQQAKLPKKPSPPPRRKRTPSEPHEFVLADNPDIAVRVIAVQDALWGPLRLWAR